MAPKRIEALSASTMNPLLGAEAFTLFSGSYMDSFRNQGPFWGPFYKGAVLIEDIKRDPNLENHPHVDPKIEGFPLRGCIEKALQGLCEGFTGLVLSVHTALMRSPLLR